MQYLRQLSSFKSVEEVNGASPGVDIEGCVPHRRQSIKAKDLPGGESELDLPAEASPELPISRCCRQISEGAITGEIEPVQCIAGQNLSAPYITSPTSSGRV
jgi:hypothetical protein